MSDERQGLMCCAGTVEPFGGASRARHYPPDLEIEPLHLDIDLRIDLERESVHGTVIVTVAARAASADTLRLQAIDFEGVDVRDPDGNALEYAYDGREIRVLWAKPLERGERRRVAVRYRVTHPVSGLYFSRPVPEYPDRPWYAVTDHETERARYWLPCVDLPNVRTTLEFRLRAKATSTILANGSLIGERTHRDGTKTVRWRLDQRCPSYLICFAIGDFVRVDDDEIEGVPIAYFASRPFGPEHLKRSFDTTPRMLAWMTRKLDLAYPYPKYFQIALPVSEGAMENISLVNWSDVCLLDRTLALEWKALVDSINVHEMAHSYFGDLVVCRDFAHAWLKESWATYMEQCWLEDNAGSDEALYDYFRNAEAYFEEADTHYQRPIVTREYDSSRDLYDRHLYPGGACRLHTLRCEIGDETFWNAVRQYLKRYANAVVETDDFRKVMEEHSGRSLGEFFEQWFYRPGYPSIRVSFEYDARRRLGRFDIEQKQATEVEKGSVFKLRTSLGWSIGGKHHRQAVLLENARSSFEVPMREPPEQVRFDPGCEILHKLEFNPGTELLRRQLRQAPDVIGRIRAVRELAKTGRRSNVEMLIQAYAKEEFWGVRQQIAQALGRVGTDAALAGMLKLIGSERDPRVMESVFRAALGFRDTRIRDAIRARLDTKLPYRALGAAYELLGAQREQAPWPTLSRAAQRTEFSGFAQGGALLGVAATGRAEAVDLLMRLSRFGELPERARGAAVRALAQIGTRQAEPQRKRVVEGLQDLLRDPDFRVRRAAALGLRTIGASESIPALYAYRATLPHQDQVKVDRHIEAIRGAQKTPDAATKAELERLQEQYRSMESRLAKLEGKLDKRGR